jgi:predicted metalloprotease
VEPGFYNAFFCPIDGAIYVDPTLMDDLADEFSPFAAAVVIAHEWGHHLQAELGITDDAYTSITTSLTEPTSLQVELQADCLAGVWAAQANADGRLEPGDLDRAVYMMASFLGDGDLPPGTHDDPWYLDEQHGDGALRAWWFLRGFGGGVEDCGIADPE